MIYISWCLHELDIPLWRRCREATWQRCVASTTHGDGLWDN